jgi:hypothetical protein
MTPAPYRPPTDRQTALIRELTEQHSLAEPPVYGSSRDAHYLIEALLDGSYRWRWPAWQRQGDKWGGVRCDA